jgi:hypothetical protein
MKKIFFLLLLLSLFGFAQTGIGSTTPVTKLHVKSNGPTFRLEGTDESGSTTTWGHTAPAYLNAFAFTELRLYGATSAHGRIIHFKTNHTNTINYFRTGTGSMTGINTNFTTLASHTAFLPNSAANFFNNEGTLAMTNFPFWLNGTYHWGIQGHGGRWEVDDFPNSASNNTHHQI